MYRPSKRTQGTETSKYLKENKETSIPLVAASETGIAQTDLRVGVADTNICVKPKSNCLERQTIEGDSPVNAWRKRGRCTRVASISWNSA